MAVKIWVVKDKDSFFERSIYFTSQTKAITFAQENGHKEVVCLAPQYGSGRCVEEYRLVR